MIAEEIVNGNTTIQYSINPLNRYHRSINFLLKTLLKTCLLILVVIIYLGLILLISSKLKGLNIF